MTWGVGWPGYFCLEWGSIGSRLGGGRQLQQRHQSLWPALIPLSLTCTSSLYFTCQPLSPRERPAPYPYWAVSHTHIHTHTHITHSQSDIVTHTLRTIYVDRDNPASRKECTDEIVRRAQDSAAGWPKILIFPEATTHSREVLLQFKKGAFLPGVPVQVHTCVCACACVRVCFTV